MHVPHEEVGNVLTDDVRLGTTGEHCARLILRVATDDALDARLFNLDIRFANAVGNAVDAHRAAVPGVFNLVNIVKTDEAGGVPHVPLDKHALLRQTAYCRRDTYPRRGVNANFTANLLHVNCLDNAPGDGTRHALTQVGSVVREVEVGIAHLARVERTAQVGVYTKGHAAVDSVRQGEFTIAARADRSTRNDVYLKRATRFMLRHRTLRNSRGYHLGRTCRTKAPDAQDITVVNICSRLLGGKIG